LCDIVSALEDETTLICYVYGKTVHIVKMTDKLTTKVNELTLHLRTIDSTLSTWRQVLSKFMQGQTCKLNSHLDFLGQFSSETSKLFQMLLR